MRKLLAREANSLFSPLIDVVLNVLGAVFLLLLLYLYLAPPDQGEPLRFLGVRPAPVVRGLDYVFTFPVTGGCRGNRSFTLRGQLPSGLVFDQPSGTIYGVVLTPGEFLEVPLHLEVRDEACMAIHNARLRIYPTAVAYNPKDPLFGLSRKAKLLPTGRVGAPYETVIGAVGGIQPYFWSEKGLPRGLQIVQGRIVGYPQVAGDFDVAITSQFFPSELRHGERVVRWEGGSATATYSLRILSRLSYEAVLPEGRVDKPYVGGILSGSWLDGEIVRWTGKVPGLHASADGRNLLGRPTAEGRFNLSFRILRDGIEAGTGQATALIAPREEDLRIGPAVFQAWQGEPVRSSIPYRGAREPVSIEPLDELPKGLRIVDGDLAGTPESPGITRVRLRIRDALNRMAEGELTIRVGGRF